MLRTTTNRQARRTVVFCSNSATVLPRNVCDCRRLTGAQASFLAQRVLQSRIAFLNSSMKYTVYRKKKLCRYLHPCHVWEMLYISQLAATVNLDKQTYGNQIQFFFRPLASGDSCEYCKVLYAVRIYLSYRNLEIWRRRRRWHVVMANSYNKAK
jgi:hypothetical protein